MHRCVSHDVVFVVLRLLYFGENPQKSNTKPDKLGAKLDLTHWCSHSPSPPPHVISHGTFGQAGLGVGPGIVISAKRWQARRPPSEWAIIPLSTLQPTIL